MLDLIDGEVYETLSAEVYDTLMEYGNNDSISEEEAFKLLYTKEVQGELEKEQLDEYITENDIDKSDYIYDIISVYK